MSYEYQKIHKPGQCFQTYMKHQAYINIRINLSTAANSIVYWRYTIINQSYAAIVDLFLYLWSKIHQTVQILEPETKNPYSSSPALQLQPFDIQKYGIILDDDDGANDLQ